MITSAVQRGSNVHVFGDGGKILFVKNGELMGYTGDSVSVKTQTRLIQVFNAKGHILYTR